MFKLADPAVYAWPPTDPDAIAAEDARGPIRKGRDIETSWPTRLSRKSVDDEADAVAAVEDMHAAFEGFKARQEDRMDALEVALRRSPRGADNVKVLSAYDRNFSLWARKGDAAPGLDVKTLALAPDTAGGYLAPPQWLSEITKHLTEFSPIRQVARVVQVGAGQVIIPRRTSNLAATWTAELADRTASQQTYGDARITAHELATYVPVSNQLLDDNQYNLEAEIGADLAEAFAYAEGAAFVNGDGIGKPFGLMTNDDIAQTVSGSATDLTADALIELLYSLPKAYRGNATWAMNADTLARVRKLKDGNGQYLWQPGLAGQPEGLLGRPLIEAEDMADVAAGTYPILVGDFRIGYRIVDRIDIAILRDPYSQATNGKTLFHARKRVGGDVLQPLAFRKLKVAAA